MTKIMEKIGYILGLSAVAYCFGTAFGAGIASGEAIGKAMAEWGERIANEHRHKTDENATDSGKETT